MDEAASVGGLIPANVFRLPGCPGVASPIAAAFVFAESDGWACPPGVLMNNDAGSGRIRISLVRVPADIALAYDSGRGAGACDRQQASTEGGAKYGSSERHLRISFRVSKHAR